MREILATFYYDMEQKRKKEIEEELEKKKRCEKEALLKQSVTLETSARNAASLNNHYKCSKICPCTIL